MDTETWAPVRLSRASDVIVAQLSRALFDGRLPRSQAVRARGAVVHAIPKTSHAHAPLRVGASRSTQQPCGMLAGTAKWRGRGRHNNGGSERGIDVTAD
jgi:hypothetical protein